jgi:hypothetical protein
MVAKGENMQKNLILLVVLTVLNPLAYAEHWRYCAANAPESSPCKAYVASALAGNPPTTDSNEVPRYASNTHVSLTLSPLHMGEVPSFGHASNSALEPFVQKTTSILVR